MGIGFLPLRASQMKRREDMAVRNAQPAFTLPRETRPNGAGASMSSSVTANGKRPKKIPTIIFNEDSEGVRRRQDTPPPIILPGISYSTTTSATTAPSDSLSGGTSSPSADSNLSNQWETPRTHLKLANRAPTPSAFRGPMSSEGEVDEFDVDENKSVKIEASPEPNSYVQLAPFIQSGWTEKAVDNVHETRVEAHEVNPNPLLVPQMSPAFTYVDESESRMSVDTLLPLETLASEDLAEPLHIVSLQIKDIENSVKELRQVVLDTCARSTRTILSSARTSRYDHITTQPLHRQSMLQRRPPNLERHNLQKLKSPFDGKQSRESNAHKSVSESRQIHTIIHGEHKATTFETKVLVSRCRHQSIQIPKYAEHTRLGQNPLAKNNNAMPPLPFLGDDYDGLQTGLYEDIGNNYGRSSLDPAIRHLQNEHWADFGEAVESFLVEMGLSWNDILYYFLDLDHRPPDIDWPPNAKQAWEARDISGDNKFDRRRKLWVDVRETLTEPRAELLALSGLVCSAVKKLCGFSLWSFAAKSDFTIARKALLKMKKKKKERDSSDSERHGPSDLQCLICHVYNCEIHGAFVEEETSNSDSESSVDDQVDWQKQDEYNTRQRMVTTPLNMRLFKGQKAKIAYDGSRSRKITDYLGMNGDKSISGVCGIEEVDESRRWPDDDLCSKQCFWQKSNRTTAVSAWPAAELDTFRELLPCAIDRRRGPCILAMSIKRSCREIFTMMLDAAGSHQDPDTAVRQTVEGPRTTHKQKSLPYWLEKSITHNLQERPPFEPCSHEGSCHTANCVCYRTKVACEQTCACESDCKRRIKGCSCKSEGMQTCWQDDRCDCFVLNRECDPLLCGECGVYEKLNPINRYNDEIQMRGCRNSAAQRDVPKRTIMGNSEIAGWGLFAGEDIKKHSYIGEYKGEVISSREMMRRGAIYAYMEAEYLFRLNKTQDVDSNRAGNKIRFINYSKGHLNCYAKVVLCNTVPRIGLYAKKNIKAGEELFFDYGYPETVTKYFWDKGEIKPTDTPVRKPSRALKQGSRTALHRHLKPAPITAADESPTITISSSRTNTRSATRDTPKSGVSSTRVSRARSTQGSVAAFEPSSSLPSAQEVEPDRESDYADGEDEEAEEDDDDEDDDDDDDDDDDEVDADVVISQSDSDPDIEMHEVVDSASDENDEEEPALTNSDDSDPPTKRRRLSQGTTLKITTVTENGERKIDRTLASERMRKAWVTRKKLYGEKGVRPKNAPSRSMS